MLACRPVRLAVSGIEIRSTSTLSSGSGFVLMCSVGIGPPWFGARPEVTFGSCTSPSARAGRSRRGNPSVADRWIEVRTTVKID